MHIVYVIDSLDAGGGAEESVAALARHYAHGGHLIDVAYLAHRPGLHEPLREAGVRLFHVGERGGRVAQVRRLARFLRNRRPELAHTTLFEADIVGRSAGMLSRVPVVSSLVTVSYGEEQMRDPRLRPWRLRAAQAADVVTARAVSRFHAVTEFVADVMARRLLVPRRRIEVVPRGRDPGALGEPTPGRRALARQALEVDAGTPLVLAAARHEYAKGLDVLIEAFPLVRRRVPEARLAVAGLEGTQTPGLREAVARLGLAGCVTMLGNRTDLPDLLCGADVLAFPSRWEGSPGVLLEAMGLQTPVVASDIPSVREMLGDERCGWLPPPDRPDALGAALVAAIDDRADADARADRARERFLKLYTFERVAQRMLALYERAVG